MPFKLRSDFEPQGDQPQAIEALVRGLNDGAKDQVLLGITGSGKTFSVASVIERTQRPTLVIAHNKTLAAQLYQEFKSFFPENSVEYFVSYYDYYQPEAYVPASDTYIEKEATINEEIDRLRLSATRALFERRDVIVVASVSCIYGLGRPGRLLRHAALRRAGHEGDARGAAPKTGRATVRALRHRVRPRQFPRPRRCRRGLPELSGSGLPHRAVGRRGRFRLDHRPAARRSPAQAHVAPPDLPEDALRDAEEHHQARAQDHPRRTRLVGAEADSGGQARRGAAPPPAHDVRP